MDSFEAVVVGSGFGGTISALSLANYLKEKGSGQVCILERGQWWLSHETPFTTKEERKPDHNRTMLEFLVDEKKPFNFWAHPDNTEGLFNLLSMSRITGKQGLYDFHSLSKNVNVITASGVGGGSLIYSNVTVRPDKTIYENWPGEKNESLEQYFEIAENFMGVNKIVTIAGLTGAKLERSKVFHEAADKLTNGKFTILNKGDYALNLSITDVENKLFSNLTEVNLPAVKAKYNNPMQTNVCERQARCNLGCVPGARHTLNKRLFRAIQDEKKPLIIKPLCQAIEIEFDENAEFQYLIKYKQYDEADNEKENSIQTKILVVASGTLGTTELLHNCKKLKLSKKLGWKFSTNADMLAYQKLESIAIDITRGPINTSHVKFSKENKFAFNIEDTAIPPMVANLFGTIFENPTLNIGIGIWQSIRKAFSTPGLRRELFFKFSMNSSLLKKLLISLSKHNLVLKLTKQPIVVGRDPVRIIRDRDEKTRMEFTPLYSFLNWITSNRERPFDSPSQRLSKFFVYSCMGVDGSNGKLTINQKGNDIVGNLNLEWNPNEDKKYFEEILEGVKLLADKVEKNGSKNVYSPTWNEKEPDRSNLILLHPLGGCSIGETIDDGVVNAYGQVFRDDSTDKKSLYPNFYVIDGSIIPSAVGVNPSLAIAAISFRCIKHLLGSDKYWPKPDGSQ